MNYIHDDEQWCCDEVFHTPTLTIGKKIYPFPLLWPQGDPAYPPPVWTSSVISQSEQSSISAIQSQHSKYWTSFSTSQSVSTTEWRCLSSPTCQHSILKSNISKDNLKYNVYHYHCLMMCEFARPDWRYRVLALDAINPGQWHHGHGT